MDKKKFIPTEIEITWFDTEDIITTSNGEESSNPDENVIHDDL